MKLQKSELPSMRDNQGIKTIYLGNLNKGSLKTKTKMFLKIDKPEGERASSSVLIDWLASIQNTLFLGSGVFKFQMFHCNSALYNMLPYSFVINQYQNNNWYVQCIPVLKLCWFSLYNLHSHDSKFFLLHHHLILQVWSMFFFLKN